MLAIVLTAPLLTAPADPPPVLSEPELARRERGWQNAHESLAELLDAHIGLADDRVARLRARLAVARSEDEAESLGNQIGAELEQQAECRRQLQELRAALVNGRPYFVLSRAAQAVAREAAGGR